MEREANCSCFLSSCLCLPSPKMCIQLNLFSFEQHPVPCATESSRGKGRMVFNGPTLPKNPIWPKMSSCCLGQLSLTWENSIYFLGILLRPEEVMSLECLSPERAKGWAVFGFFDVSEMTDLWHYLRSQKTGLLSTLAASWKSGPAVFNDWVIHWERIRGKPLTKAVFPKIFCRGTTE